MREILFRGKTTKGKWVEGDLYQSRLKSVFMISRYTEYGNRMTEVVNPETVGQYTGLTDKNGKRVFEGDIVKISDINENFVCVWEKDNFEYEFKNKTMSFSVCGVHQDDIEIIGNIHDNPELLKGE